MKRFDFDLSANDNEVFNLKLDLTKHDFKAAIEILKAIEYRHKNKNEINGIFEDVLLKIILDLQELELGIGYLYKFEGEEEE